MQEWSFVDERELQGWKGCCAVMGALAELVEGFSEGLRRF